MLTNMKAVIFDLDGTLIDSMWIWREIDREYLARYHVPLPEDLQERIAGMSFTETARYVKERFGIPDSIEAIKKTWTDMAWEAYEKRVPLKKGVRPFLDYLRGEGIVMAIATSNSHEMVNMVTKVHGIYDYFSAIVTGCDVTKGKPSPDVYLKAAEKIQVEPEHCLVFEDIVQGILAGKNAGMRVCAVADESSQNQVQEKRRLADYYIETYEELLNTKAGEV